MSVQVTMRIKNLPEIRRAFRLSPKIMGQELAHGIEKSVRLVNAYAKTILYSGFVIRRTGYLRASHETRFEGSGMNFTGIIEPRAHYAIYLHEGTRYIRPRPWLKAAVDHKVSDVDGIIGGHVQQALNRIGRMT